MPTHNAIWSWLGSVCTISCFPNILQLKGGVLISVWNSLSPLTEHVAYHISNTYLRDKCVLCVVCVLVPSQIYGVTVQRALTHSGLLWMWSETKQGVGGGEDMFTVATYR